MSDTYGSAPDPTDAQPAGETDDLQAVQTRHNVQREGSRHRRDERFRGVLSHGMLGLAVLIIVIVAAAFLTLGWHMLAPGDACEEAGPNWHWLCRDEIRAVKDFVLSGALIALGMQYIRRYIEDR